MIDFERGERAEGERAYLLGTVFQTAVPRLGFNPETSSRVTLASLGIAFQAKVIR